MREVRSASTSTERFPATHPNSGLESVYNLTENDSTVHQIPISLLLPADSPRQQGEDIKHTRTLAGVEAQLPPIIVHRSTMRVIDGMHRLGAALLRGDEKIDVQFFDGTEQEAFVLAVKRNIAHGLPLSRADRTIAAKRIIASHPTWSDRAIAAAAGLGARTVGKIRHRLDAANGTTNGERARLGRDGKIRPLDHAEGRRRAFEIIKDRPDASLREVARGAGVSPTTAHDVRKRIQRGEDPIPSTQIPGQRGHHTPPVDVTTKNSSTNHGTTTNPGATSNQGIASMLHGLKNDPSLCLTEAGRGFLRWVLSRVVHPGEWRGISAEIPPHCTYILADVARQCASEWTEIANDLERRSSRA